MTTLTIDEVQAPLPEVVHRLAPGEEVVILENNEPVAKLVGKPMELANASRPGPGLCKGMITYMAPDFDAPLEDMQEYMG
jgi:antitoxin (DNA-binding transcriptional repressor) of toxin-antitoxin stability system